MISVGQYLERIGIPKRKEPGYEFLAELQFAHLLRVPFETHDIHSGIRIICDEEGFLRKILLRNRGGFCYELNTAFAWLLKNLGFHVTLLSGRVARAGGGYGPEFDHMTLLVHLEQDYIVDVGFTTFSTIPLLLNGEERTDTPGTSRIERQEGEDFSFSRFEDNKWKIEYLFTLTPRMLPEFAAMCRFHESAPESPFIKKPLAAIYTRSGRITISGNTLIVLENGVRTTREIDDAEKKDLLMKHFTILCQ
jgi:N-hydroxyarylamine O-acetyltransferase